MLCSHMCDGEECFRAVFFQNCFLFQSVQELMFKKPKPCGILLSALMALQAGDISAASYNDLPESFRTGWEALLHYNGAESVISGGSSFFLSPNGNTAPDLELESTMDFLEKNPKAWCVYPARYYLIYGSLPEDFSVCPDFYEYSRNIGIEKLSVVFASEDETSPISTMGHVFIVLEGKNSRGLTKRHNFGFVADTEGSASLFWNFLTGSIIGRYTLTPYDDTIYRYISEEHRTLWEYELNLGPDELRMLFLHLYELKTHKISYSFFTNNCATGLNRVIAAVKPEIAYSSATNIVTPVEYVKHINRQNLTSGIIIRPSETDKLYLEKELPLNPLKSPPTSRISAGYLYDSRYGSGMSFDFLPLYSDLHEDSSYTSKINQSQFLRISAEIFPEHARITGLRIIDIHSLPNINYEKFKINFGLDLHSDVTGTGGKLYPDLHAGTGIAFSSYGFIPYIETDGGIHYEKGGANFYASLTGGLMYRSGSFGRMTAYARSYAATENDYRGFKSAIALIYSKQLSENFWLKINGEHFFIKNSSNLTKIGTEISFRF